MGLALDLEDYHPSVLLHCWFGHLTCKIVSKMTYNVSSWTLIPTIQCNTNLAVVCVDFVFIYFLVKNLKMHAFLPYLI